MGKLEIPPIEENMNNFSGSNAFGKHSSIYNPIGSQNL
jgi:hypothetical protein